MKQALLRLWPKSLTGRLFLAVAITLLATQSLNGVLLYRAQNEQRVAVVTNAIAVRMVRAVDRLNNEAPRRGRRGPDRLEGRSDEPRFLNAPQGRRFRDRPGNGLRERGRRRRGLEFSESNPTKANWPRLPRVENRLSTLLTSYDVNFTSIIVARDPRPQIVPLERLSAVRAEPTDRTIVGAVQLDNGNWLSVRLPEPSNERSVTAWLIFQTVTLYLILLGVIFYITRTLSRPLKKLNTAMADFTESQQISKLPEQGPEDVAALTRNFNIMSQRIGTMLDEKDVMLGAIGHDLKTPLSALRVRVESVKDDVLRGKMIASIEDLRQSLDEILLLARLGRGQEEHENVNLGAMLDTIVDEFVQLGKPVTLEPVPRIVGRVYATWFRRAMRNLIANAVRYGGAARVSLNGDAIGDEISICIDDDGPGIPEEELEKIFTPFYRLEKSRNSQTGGAGLGLTLARAIAEKHGGTIRLSNRYDADGNVAGLRAIFTFPRSERT
jgi:signal transduction histidine kinase